MLLQSVASLNDAASASSTLSDSKGSILSDVNDALIREIKTFEAREKLIYHFKVISYLIMFSNCSYLIRILAFGRDTVASRIRDIISN